MGMGREEMGDIEIGSRVTRYKVVEEIDRQGTGNKGQL